MAKWWQATQSVEVQAHPWLAPAVIAKLEEIVKPNFKVLEHGCGGSTLWFAERCKSVIATDGNADWREQINARLDQTKARVFTDLGQLHSEGVTDKFDLILIDGEPVTDRAMWIKESVNLVKPGGWIVLDNCNRPEYAAERLWLQEQVESFETFNGNEPGTLYLVTEFYKAKKATKDENRQQPEPKRKSRKLQADNSKRNRTPSEL